MASATSRLPGPAVAFMGRHTALACQQCSANWGALVCARGKAYMPQGCFAQNKTMAAPWSEQIDQGFGSTQISCCRVSLGIWPLSIDSHRPHMQPRGLASITQAKLLLGSDGWPAEQATLAPDPVAARITCLPVTVES